MATTYVSTKCGTGAPYKSHLHDDTLICDFDIAADIGTAAEGGGGAGGTAFVINDVVQMVKVAKGMIVTGVCLAVPALDSSTGIVVAVGDGSDDDRFISGSTKGRSSTAGVEYLNAAAGQNYAYTADDTIDFKVKTAATGTAVTSGIIHLAVRVRPA